MTDQPQGPTEPTADAPTPEEPTEAARPPEQPAPPVAPPPPHPGYQQVPPPVPPVVGGIAQVGNPGAYPGWTGPGQAYPQPVQAYPAQAQAYPPPAATGPAQGYGAPPANPYGGYGQAPVYAGGGGAAYPGSLAFVEQNYGKVADFGQRALAYLIDIAVDLIGLIPAIIGSIMLVAAAPGLESDPYGNVSSAGDGNSGLAVLGGLLIALGVVLGIGIWLWNRVFRMGRTGQSVGKKVIGLYLLDDKTGQPVGAGRCFLRELVQGLVNQIFYLGWLWMLWDAEKQTLGDKSVHSSVVVVPKS